MSTQTRTGPLQGIKVLDLTTVVMGPSATQILGDMGANVLKIEAPAGDSLRFIGPSRHESMGALFLQSNRSKQGLVLDLKSSAGQSRMLSLLSQADVFVTNVRPQGIARLGLDYESLRDDHPRLIHCQLLGYGSDGPYAGEPVYDDLIQAASGISGLFERIDGAPRYAPINICDRVSGLYGLSAILAALFERSQSGLGQAIEVPMFEAMAAFTIADHMGGQAFEPPMGPPGYLRLLSRFRGPYPTRDGHLAVVVYTDVHWKKFCALVDRPDILADPVFATQQSRTLHAETVGQVLSDVLRQHDLTYWLENLRAIDIPCAPVNALEDLFDDPHLAAVGLFEEHDHPTEGRIRMPRTPFTFSRSATTTTRLAPGLDGESPEGWSA